ncbi:MAG: PEP-CTERM sorting domain-containing protein [Planctomycetota bacterium]
MTVTLGLTAPALADEDDEEGPGVPHIVVADEAGNLALEFELVPAVDINGIPTVTVFLPNYNALADEFTSNPVGGLSDGFLNDDNGFESEGIPAGSNIVISLEEVLFDDSDGFFVALGSEIIPTNATSFTLGNAFDDHPIFGLQSDDPDFVGSASLVFEVTDTNNALAGTETFGVIITTDPSLATVPEPSSALLLAGAGLIAARRRRRA